MNLLTILLFLWALLWSTPANKVLDMPAYFFVKFFYNHGMLEVVNRPKWWVIKNGFQNHILKKSH